MASALPPVLFSEQSFARRTSVPVALSGVRAAEAETYLGCCGDSIHAQEVISFIAHAAQQARPILLLGEAGLRQEELARAIHRASAQARQPFLAINAQGLREEALYQLLFGDAAHPGVLQTVQHGTIFVSDLVCLSPRLHQRLAVYLEERHWLRNAMAEQRLVLSADTKVAEIAENRMAHSLVAMLRAHSFALHPLRERRGDLGVMANELVKRLTPYSHRAAVQLSPQATELLVAYDWPQNFDELESALRGALAQIPPQAIEEDNLPARVRFAHLRSLPETGVDMPRLVDDYERNLLATALQQTGYSQTKAARLLGLRVQTLNMKLKRLAEQGTPVL